MVDVSDILGEGAEEYAKKHEDYGNSWRNIGRILHILAGGETVTLETPQDYVAMGLFTRRLDKFARAFNGEFVSDEMNFEPTADAHTDEMVYAAMAAANIEERPPNEIPHHSSSGPSDGKALKVPHPTVTPEEE